MAGAILEVRTLAQEITLGSIGGLKYERLVARGVEDALLHQVQFDIQNLAQFIGTERLERDDLIQTVDELRRELPASSFDTAALDFAVKLLVGLARKRLPYRFTRDESQFGIHE